MSAGSTPTLISRTMLTCDWSTSLSHKKWQGRGHFFAAAAEAMRRILFEKARRERRQKHGGHLQRVELHDPTASMESPVEDLLALDEALTRFPTTWR